MSCLLINAYQFALILVISENSDEAQCIDTELMSLKETGVDGCSSLITDIDHESEGPFQRKGNSWMDCHQPLFRLTNILYELLELLTAFPNVWHQFIYIHSLTKFDGEK